MATQIPLDKIIDNPFQPRQAFDPAALQSLAEEMRAEGFWAGALQGRRTKNGKVELVFGHRRLRALRLLKTATVTVEIVELTDAQMALRSLEENLQREGLTDLEKADAVKRAVEIATAERESDGKPTRGVIAEVARRLGLDPSYVSALCEISGSILPKQRIAIQAGKITALTAIEAKRWGGSEYVDTLARQGKEALGNADVAKPTHITVQAMKRVVKEAPESIQEKLKAAIIKGEVTTPAEAEQKWRRLGAERAKRNKLPPPDLHHVIIDWTHRLEDWDAQMKDVTPYMDYIDEVPEEAKAFRAALKHFIATAEKLL